MNEVYDERIFRKMIKIFGDFLLIKNRNVWVKRDNFINVLIFDFIGDI